MYLIISIRLSILPFLNRNNRNSISFTIQLADALVKKGFIIKHIKISLITFQNKT